jgi:hypothetical protein
MPGILDRIHAGLLGPTTNYGGLLDPRAEEQAKRDAMMALSSNLLAQSGWSQTPTTLGQAMGGAVNAGRQTQNESLNSALQANLLKSQIAKNERPNLPTSAEEFEYYKKLSPEDRIIFDAMKKKAGPAAIQEFEYFKGLSPDDQATYTKLQRQPTVPKIVNIGNVPHLVDPVTGVRTPLSSLENEMAGAGAVKQAEGYGAAVGKAAGEVAGGIQKKSSDAQGVQTLLEGADALIDVATGSTVGVVRDKVAAVFGYAPDGAQAIAELKILQANLMLQQPRMEGPQSDRDAILYREAAGQIGDPSVPAATKKTALRKILELQNKYRERAEAEPASIPTTPPGAAATAPGKKPSGESAAERAKRMGL